MLNGQENFTTVKINTTRGRLPQNSVYSILRKYWDPRLCDSVKNMKALRDGTGVVFDIRAEYLDGFQENFNRLVETGERIDFVVSKC